MTGMRDVGLFYRKGQVKKPLTNQTTALTVRDHWLNWFDQTRVVNQPRRVYAYIHTHTTHSI